MDFFEHRNGVLHAEGVSVAAIANAVGAPVYIYSTATLKRHYRAFATAFRDVGLDVEICFAVKANSNQAVLRTLAKMGAGADVVSGGELQLALRAGIPARKIVFSGMGKTRAELALALDAGIYQINVESSPELEILSALAVEKNVTAAIAIRVNPDVGAGGHQRIVTGAKDTKFGVQWAEAPDVYRRASALEGIDARGIAMHIGSQITTLAPFEAAFGRMRDLHALLRSEGIGIDRLDLGGGLGVPHGDDDNPPSPAAYAQTARRTVGDLGCALMCEPGRLIAANAGILAARVILVKPGEKRTFAVVDAGINDFARPTMYDAWHDIVPVRRPAAGAKTVAYDVVGPLCETSDVFARGRPLAELAAGDLIVLRTAGAYGASMASQYNARPLTPEVLVKGERFHLIRRRPTLSDMVALEETPDWL